MHTQNNFNLYDKLLVKFLKKNQNFSEQFNLADTTADPHIKQRLAHTLKSSSANIGAQVLADYCQLLEKSCENLDVQQIINHNLSRIIHELEPIIRILEKYVNQYHQNIPDRKTQKKI